MELPADPKNLVYGIYNKKGYRVDLDEKEEDKEVPYAVYALSDEDEDNQYLETPFNMVDYFYS